MNAFCKASARRIIIGTLMAAAFILPAFNLHAVQKQTNKSDAHRAPRGASRQLKLIFHSAPIHPRLQGWAFSAHTGLLKENKPDKESQKTYNITFFSLKRGHSIAPGTLLLYDNGNLEIKLDRGNLITPQGKYTVADYLFEGDWEFTLIRTKPYHYASHFKGLYLFDTYIIGLCTLKEYIEDQRLTQEIPFVFFAALREKEAGSQKPKDRSQNSGNSSQKDK